LNIPGNLEFKQEGYLILATSEQEHEQFVKNVELQNSLDIPSVLLSKEQALEIVPHLNPDSFVSATFCPSDGHLNPFKMTEAYMLAAKRLGVTFSFFEEVTKINRKDDTIISVETNKETYITDIVVNAAGGYSAEVGALAEIDIPVYSENHEILATEPLREFKVRWSCHFQKISIVNKFRMVRF
jgi:sarcosine oxidase, subunit beta